MQPQCQTEQPFFRLPQNLPPRLLLQMAWAAAHFQPQQLKLRHPLLRSLLHQLQEEKARLL